MTPVRRPDVCVVGSSNVDYVARAARLPKVGETVFGHTFLTSFGGKGANQAAMAARLGARVTMVSRIGRDGPGREVLENFRALGIDARHVTFDGSASTGVALIAVDDQGRNLLVAVPGANRDLSPADVERAAGAIRAADVLVCQLEVPLETTLRALQIAREGEAAGRRVFTLLNPAPLPDRPLPPELLGLADVVVPNETEAEKLTGLPVETLPQVEAAARRLLEMGAARVIVTLGGRGALLAVRGAGARHFPAVPVEAVDSTGAGDAFVGALAWLIGRGDELEGAVRRAGAIAAVSVTRPGAQVSYPRAEEIPHLLDGPLL